ncbi:MAG: LacI family DNA-binding transcriptional regulator [Capsulimonadaceae bacterium]|nr:LacI family DNA-binding transcriptional regulator [Capsulimonadaceae bacterium]
MISSLEIAKLCGISQGTVDRALHGRPGVSAETKRRVEEIAREYGYRPHPGAREMLTGKSAILGALVPSMNGVFFMDFMQVVKTACDQYNLRMFITPVADHDEFLDALNEFAARRVAGVLAVPPSADVLVPEEIARTLRIASLLGPTATPTIPLFAPDEVSTGADATAYLIGLGHTRIVHATYRRRAQAIADRTRGYEETMRTAGLTPRVTDDLDAQAWRRLLNEYRPTAVFCHNDRLALNVIRLVETEGLSVPRDLAVMGIDNSPTFEEFNTQLTTMTYPFDEIARKALRWIVDGVDERPISRMPIVERRTTRMGAEASGKG